MLSRLQDVVQLLCDGHGVRKRRLARVEIKQDIIGLIETHRPGQPGVEGQGPLIHEVKESCKVVDEGIVNALATLGRQLEALYPFRIVRRCIFLPEMRRLGITEPLRKPL